MATREEMAEFEFKKLYDEIGEDVIRSYSPQNVFRIAFLAGRESVEKEMNMLLWLILNNMGGIAIIEDSEIESFDHKKQTLKREYDIKNKCTKIYRSVSEFS